jgi:endo-1,4-beta-D-glucanase Y
MRIRLFLFLFLLFIEASAQINTPDTCKVPFGLISQSTSIPYAYGLIPSNLPTGSYQYLSSSAFGKSQDAYNAYNAWKAAYVEDCGGGNLRVKFDNPAQTVSEGIAYGMLLSVYAADKAVFDGLYNYYKSHSNANGIMHWRINGCSGTSGFNGATDAELDAAMALIVAECQWPNVNSPYDYSTEATTLINAIKAYEINATSYQTTNGDGWGSTNPCRNPSYFSPAYYKQFALQVPADSAFWAVNVVNASYSFLNANRNSTTGLVSNWANNTGAPNTCNGPLDYGYDACRNPWRMAADVLWYNDANAKDILTKVTNWLKGTSTTCAAPVALNASSPNNGSSHNSLFTSTWAVATMGGGNTTTLNDFYKETVKLTDGGYYGTTIRTVMLFMLSGNFWKPCPVASYVDLANFTVTQQAGKVSINFSSNMELENVHFNLYVSSDNVNYTLIQQFPGSLHSNSSLEYSFQEERYIDQTVYYKLTFIDSDGTEKELKTQSVFRETKVEALLAPNPFEEEFKVYLSTPDNNPIPVKIVDARGRIVMNRTDFPANEDYTLRLDIPTGVYFLVATYGKKNYSFKLLRR